MPSSSKAKQCILASLPHRLEGKVYELGSGWGTLAFPLAKNLPHCQVIGCENSPIPFLFSKFRYFFNPLPNLNLSRTDFFQIDLNDASLIVCYLYPGAMKRLRKKFEKELKPNTWIITNTFAIPGWIPVHKVQLSDLYQTTIYFYQIT